MAKRKGNQKAFLAAYAVCGRIDQAAKTAGIDRGAHYDWKKTDPAYPPLFADATERAGDAHEDECKRRAFEGILQADRYQGKVVGTKRVFSDGLAMAMLRGLKPEKYRANLEVTGPNGGPMQVSLAEVIRNRRAKREEPAPPA